MIRLTKLLAACGLALIVAGCGSEKERLKPQQIAKQVTDNLKKDDNTAPVVVTRAMLNGITDPLLLVGTQIDGGVGLMGAQAINGAHITWRTADDISLVMHGDMISSTRRFGQDLMSARTPRSPTNQSTFRREYRYLGGDEQLLRVTADCTYTAGSRETITVLDQRILTQKFTERCISDQIDDFSNIYWVDKRGISIKSKQFVSPKLGFIILQRINQ